MPTALVSVHDKTGVAEFARSLAALGWNFIASGGTFRTLSQAGIACREVSEITGFPEMLQGRVKTLHPAIHAGILARGNSADRSELESRGIGAIDMVVANLYPFEAAVARAGVTEAEAIEEIDIGGVTLLRAAAKNHARVILLCDPADYDEVASTLARQETLTSDARRRLAVKGFARTAAYDAAIGTWMAGGGARANASANASANVGAGDRLQIAGHRERTLRYGENPHQRAEFYTSEPGRGPLGGSVLQGKELSYNNILDLDAAWKAVLLFDEPAAVVVKHLSPCGIACARKGEEPAMTALATSLRAAIACDPVSAFGGVIAVNREFGIVEFRALGDLFVECIAAPSFSKDALAALAGRKNLRLVVPGRDPAGQRSEFRSVTGGFLRQDADAGDPEVAPAWRIATRRPPDAAESAALAFAWKACIPVKSNAIVLAAPLRAAGEAGAPGLAGAIIGHATVGIGGGQPNRVDSVRIAVTRSGDRARGAVLASDAFFPFADSVREAAAAGIAAIVQPGGSVRDAESVAAADESHIAMAMTGIRHFRH